MDSDRTERERHGHRDWRADRPGFYVVNDRTWISNSAPFKTHGAAQQEIDRIARKWGDGPDPLVVVEVAA